MHADADLSESHGASQIEAPNIGNTETCSVCKTFSFQLPLNGKFLVGRPNSVKINVPASSVAKISRWQRKTRARRAQCQAKKMGKIEEKVAHVTKHTSKKKKKKKQCIPPHHVEAKSIVPRKVKAHCFLVRLAKRREGLGAQSLADHSNLAFVIDGTKRLQDVGPQGRTEF